MHEAENAPQNLLHVTPPAPVKKRIAPISVAAVPEDNKDRPAALDYSNPFITPTLSPTPAQTTSPANLLPPPSFTNFSTLAKSALGAARRGFVAKESAAVIEEKDATREETRAPEEWETHVNSVMRIHLIRTERDLEVGMHNAENREVTSSYPNFPPEFTHALFLDDEIAYGYKNLRIDLFHLSSSFYAFLWVRWGEKKPDISANSMLCRITKESARPITDVSAKIEELLVANEYTLVEAEFRKRLAAESQWNAPGIRVAHFCTPSDLQKEGQKSAFEVFRGVFTNRNVADLAHAMQSFAIWFIDGAQFIDHTDERWELFTLYEVSEQENTVVRTVAGFCTLYRFYHHPDKIRYRISQFLIFPSYQKKGLGRKLLRAIYEHAWGREDVVDVTVEDPCCEFTRLRDLVDLNLVLEKYKNEVANYDLLNKEFARKLAKELKIWKVQAARIVDIFKFQFLIMGKLDKTKELEELNKFKIQGKKQLMRKYAEHLHAFSSDAEEQQRELDRLYRLRESEYRECIAKLRFNV